MNEILTQKEKEWISKVIAPFKDKITLIKLKNIEDYYYLRIKYYDVFETYINLNFPCFKKGTRYKGMELEKEYTLKDLGLE